MTSSSKLLVQVTSGLHFGGASGLYFGGASGLHFGGVWACVVLRSISNNFQKARPFLHFYFVSSKNSFTVFTDHKGNYLFGLLAWNSD